MSRGEREAKSHQWLPKFSDLKQTESIWNCTLILVRKLSTILKLQVLWKKLGIKEQISSYLKLVIFTIDESAHY